MFQTSARQRPDAALMAIRAMVCGLPLLVVAGCAAFPTLTTQASGPEADQSEASVETPLATDARVGERQLDTLRIPGPPPPASNARQPATQAQIEALLPDEPVDATLGPQSIPQFAATVFGGVLQLPYTLSPEAADRNEVIAGGTGGVISKRDLFRLTQQALRQYGLEVFIDNGFVTVGEAGASGTGGAGNVSRSRDVPQGSGRIVQFFPVQTVEVNVLESLLRDLFPNLSGARVTLDQLSNSLIITGSVRDVAAFVRALREIDQPRFAGAEVLRIEPVFLSADALSAALEQVLVTEGYIVSRQSAAGRSLVMLNFQAANQILVFAKDPTLLTRVRFWVDQLDRPAALGAATSTFVYQVQNTDAQSLGQLAIGQAPATTQARPPVGVPGTAPANDQQQRTGAGIAQNNASGPGATGQFMSGRLLTDPIGNRILFTGTATEYAQLRTLLQQLDQPAPQVLIEVIIAEVTLTDSTSLGVNLFGTQGRGDGILTGSTESLATGGGLVVTFRGPEFRAALSAAASNDRINILQRPQLVARSGGSARFQVGTDVPIITSQRATDFNSGGGGTDILQSVQYRQTGVILEIQPVVYGDRVNIVISQEISSAGNPPEGIASPTILNRSVTTEIALSDGTTGVLGGLISNNYTTNNSGVPFLKDLPIVGQAFQTNSVDGDRTELLVMITPTIIRNDEDMADIAAQYSADINAAFRTGRGWSYTLTPFSVGSRFRGLGFDLPTPGRASEAPPLFPRREEPEQATEVEPAPAD